MTGHFVIYRPAANRESFWRQSLLAGAAALAAVCAGSSTASAALIELKDSAPVSTPLVRLGDVAIIRDANDAVVERLAAVTLFPAPPLGRSKAVEFDTIRTRLTSQGFNLSELEFTGSSVVTVSGVRPGDDSAQGHSATADLAQKRAEEVVAGAVRQYLHEKAPSLGNVEIELKLTPRQVSLLSAALSARVDISGGAEPWPGEQTLRAGFYDRQGQRTEFQVVCRVRPLPQVLVPTATLPKGHVVRPDDVTWKQQPVTASAAACLDRTELVVGQETRRTLRAGEPISAIDIRSVPLVRRGDIVTVVARSRGIVVRTDARSLGDGGLGQPIKLVSLDGRRELAARVSGYHEASVIVPEGDEPATQGDGTGVRLLTAEARPQTGGHTREMRLTAGNPTNRSSMTTGGPNR
jgi:flagella basal body P-ring formation protein FlgA